MFNPERNKACRDGSRVDVLGIQSCGNGGVVGGDDARPIHVHFRLELGWYKTVVCDGKSVHLAIVVTVVSYGRATGGSGRRAVGGGAGAAEVVANLKLASPVFLAVLEAGRPAGAAAEGLAAGPAGEITRGMAGGAVGGPVLSGISYITGTISTDAALNHMARRMSVAGLIPSFGQIMSCASTSQGRRPFRSSRQTCWPRQCR